MMHYYEGFWFFPGIGIFFHLIPIVLFFLIIYWLINSSNMNSDSAEEILKKRLVRGEITKKQYELLKKEISKK